MSGLIGKKMGMTQIFTEGGECIPVTVIKAGPCCVVGIKSDGYQALQLGFEEVEAKKVTKPVAGQYKKNDLTAMRYLREVRSFDDTSSYNVGDVLKADVFEIGDRVKVSGLSKGKGFQGVMKRHGFGGGQTTHGQSDRLRAPGSIGQSSYPSRVLKGTRMAGRTGNQRVTVSNLEVVRVDPENNTLMIRGAVPGGKNGLLQITK